MSVTIRLSRIGKKGKPEYRIVVCEKRSKNQGAFIEVLGTLNPLMDPPKINVKKDRLKFWQSKGAQISPSLGHYLS